METLVLQTPHGDPVLTTSEVIARLRVSRARVGVLVARRKLRKVARGFFLESDVAEFERERRPTGRPRKTTT